MATNLRSAGSRSPRPDRETKSDAKQQERLRERQEREKQRQERELAKIEAKTGGAKSKNKFKTNIKGSKTDTVSAATKKQQVQDQKARDELAATLKRQQEMLERERAAAARQQKYEQAYYRDMLGSTRARRQEYMQNNLDNVAYIPDSLKMVRGFKKGGSVGYTQRWKNARKKTKR